MRRRWHWLSLPLAALHAALYALLQGPYCIDDAYISFRYAAHFARGLGLVFNAGERVEGYTNFGWVMLMSALYRAGLDLAVAARVVNFLLALVLFLAALRFLASRWRAGTPALALAGVLLAADGALARWAQDGLETLLFALLVFAGAVWTAPAGEDEPPARPVLGSVAFVLAALVRPEGALLFAAALVSRFLAAGLWAAGAWRPAFRDALRSAAVFTFLGLPYFLWRWHYFGALLPNTFYAKVGTGPAQLLRGGRYLFTFFIGQRWPLLLAVLFGLVRLASPLPAWARHFLAIAAAAAGFAFLVGGDWMGAGRFLVPVLPLLYLPAAVLIARALTTAAPLRSPAVAVLLLAQLAFTSWRGEWRSVVAERPYLVTRARIGDWLARHAAPGDTLLTGEIGQLAYLSGLYTHDLFGLTEPHIAHLVMPNMGRGLPGHEKSDLAYSLGQRPTWIVMPFMLRLYEERPANLPILAEYEPVFYPQPLPLPGYGAFLHRRVARQAASSYGMLPGP